MHPQPRSSGELVPSEGTPASGWSQWLAATVSAVVVGDLVYFVNFRAPVNWREYTGWLFVLAPVLLGFLAGSVLAWKVERPRRDHLVSAFYALAVAMVGLMFVAAEGMVCLFMALPITIPAALLGGWLSYRFQRWRWHDRPALFASALLVLPFAMAVDRRLPPSESNHVVATDITIAAPPEAIWPLLSDLHDLPDPSFWLFRAGVAFPVGVRTDGENRHCELSTGDMPERITVYEPAKRLRFEVLRTPPSMKEMNPFGEVDADHLTGYFACDAGQFELQALAGGRTRVIGTSWYHHRYAPDWYWTLWTDAIVHQVQLRMLAEIKRRAEKAT